MKILLLSDTHRNLRYARRVINSQKDSKEELDLVIHCGDNIEDARQLEEEFASLEFVCVPGNCDPLSFEDNEKIIECQNKKILITHGHRFDINYNYERFLNYLDSKNIDIGICGHTHKAHVEKEEDRDITIINPGSISLPRDKRYPSYALLHMEDSDVSNVEILRIND